MLLTDEDLAGWRALGRTDLALRTEPGHFGLRAFATTPAGECVHLSASEGRSLCAIYSIRAEVCREFQAGSWQCLEFRRERKSRTPL
jgi:Fe-S-cluster containining protein